MGKVLLPVSLFTHGCTNVCKLTSVGKDERVNWYDYKTSPLLGDDTDTSKPPHNNQIIHSTIRNHYRLCPSDTGLTFEPTQQTFYYSTLLQIPSEKRCITKYTPATCDRPCCNGSHYYTPCHFNYYYLNGVYYDFYYGSGDRWTKQAVDYIKGSISLNLIDRVSEKMIRAATADGVIYCASVIKKDYIMIGCTLNNF